MNMKFLDGKSNLFIKNLFETVDPFESSLVLATQQPQHFWGTFATRVEVTVYILCMTMSNHVTIYVCISMFVSLGIQVRLKKPTPH